ncbi:MAG TPA: hypothetical protein DCE41_24445 [Cytophagales bacterium]|nr:hypothetical protein [Cytophagales bacterium]HAA18134.1 hypothetical protein [Cytophagales bacterium]
MLDFMRTEPRFMRWLDRLIRHEKPENTIRVFHFGILQSQKGYSVYLMGQQKFDEAHEDWVSQPWDFIPSKQYFEVGDEVTPQQGWEAAIIYVRTLLLQYMQSENYQDSFFTKADALTLGSDESGEILRLK